MQPEPDIEQLAPELIGTGAQAVVNNAKRLGLTWTLTLATITSADPVEAIADGDTVAIGMTSMIGPVGLNQRVYVIQVPPSGNFICGQVQAPEYLGVMWTNLGTVATSGVGGGPAVVPSASWVQEPVFNFGANRIFAIEFTYTYISSSSNVGIADVRRGQAAAAGVPILMRANRVTEGARTSSYTQIGYAKNAGSAVATKLTVMVQHFTGGTTASVYGDSLSPLMVAVRDVGPIGSDPSIDATAVQI